jgi:hypothetical protein
MASPSKIFEETEKLIREAIEFHLDGMRDQYRHALSPLGYHSSMAPRKWSAKVMERSDALDLEQGVFAKSDPKAIARSLKRSAERSTRRKAEPFRSAMSMLYFFINRGGKNLSKKQKATLEKAKDELRIAFGREPKGRSTSRETRKRAPRASTTRKRTRTSGTRSKKARSSRSR